MARVSTLAALAIVASGGLVIAPVRAQMPADGTPVRVNASALGAGWIEGTLKLNKPSGCMMVYLDRKAPGGYTMVALNGVSRIERREKGTWVEVPVTPLLAKEPKPCREAAND